MHELRRSEQFHLLILALIIILAFYGNVVVHRSLQYWIDDNIHLHEMIFDFLYLPYRE